MGVRVLKKVFFKRGTPRGLMGFGLLHLLPGILWEVSVNSLADSFIRPTSCTGQRSERS